MTDFEAAGFIDIDTIKPIRISDTSPCLLCVWYPEKQEIPDPAYDSLVDTQYIPNDNCPMSLEQFADISVEEIEFLTSVLGCRCWRQK